MSFGQLSNGIGSVVSGFARALKNTADAHYHCFGKHTMPIRTKSEAAKVTVANTLLGAPIAIPAHVLALTVFPLVGNSVQSFGQSFSRVYNLSVYDLEKPKFDTDVVYKRSPLRHAYGLPGYLLGIVAGTVAAAMATALRIICSSFVTAKSAYISTANLLLYKEDRIERFNDLQDDLDESDPAKKRSKYSIFVFGLPGLIVGATLGLLTSGIIGIGHIVLNSFKAGGRIFVSMLRSVGKWENAKGLRKDEFEKGEAVKTLLPGAPGLVIGAIIGGISAFIAHTAITAFRMTVSMVKGVWKNTDDWKHSIKDNTKNNWGLGFLGAPIGAITGAVAAVLVFTGRVFLDSARTAGQLIKTIALAAWSGDNDAVKNGIGTNNPKDKRNLGWRYGAGAPGLVIGAVIGGIVAGMVGAIQVIRHSATTAFRMWASTFYFSIKVMQDSHAMNQDEENEVQIHQNRSSIRHNNKENWRFGFIGAPIGFVIGAVGFLVKQVFNIIAHSSRTAGLLIATMALAAWPGNNNAIEKGIGNKKDKRKWPWRFIAGAPGLIVGGAMGGLVAFVIGFGRSIQHSAINAKRLFVEMVKGVTRDDRAPHTNDWTGLKNINEDGENIGDDREKVDKYGFGLPGYAFGALFGVITATLILTYRVIANSLISAAQLYTSMIRGALSYNMPQRIKNAVGIFDSEKKNDENAYHRSIKWRYLIPSVSMILPITAVIGTLSIFFITAARTFKNSWLSASRLMVSMIRGVEMPIAIPEQWKGLGDDNERTFSEKVWFSLFGYVFGAIAGVLAVITLSIYSVVKNSVLSAGQLIKTMTNGARPGDNHAFNYGIGAYDGRNPYWRYLGGSPGLAIGAVIGGISAIFIGLGRTIACSTLIAFKVAHKMAVKVRGHDNQAWVNRAPSFFNIIQSIEDQQFLKEPVNKYGFGLPGYLFGGIIGSVYAIGIMTARIITHAMVSGAQIFRSMLRGALPENLSQKVNGKGIFPSPYLEQHDRHPFWRYGVGSPGILIAAVFGGITAFAIGVARFVYQSAINTKRVFVSMTKFASYHESTVQNWQGVNLNDPRNVVDKHIFGAPGYLLGAISGVLSVFFVAAGRVIANNLLSAYETIVSMVRFALPQKLSDKVTQKGIFDYLKNDDSENADPHHRHWYWRHMIASPGIAIGFVFGAISAMFINIGRVVWNTMVTSWRVMVSVMRLGLPKADDYINKESFTKDWKGYEALSLENKKWGCSGFVFGGIMGAITLPLVAGGRFISNSLLSGFGLIMSTLSLFENSKASVFIGDKFPVDHTLSNDPRRGVQKYLFGSLGLVIGAAISAVAAVLMSVAFFIKHTVKSWQAFSGSMINGSLNLPVFEGLGGDKAQRKGYKQAIGGLGYVFATVTTLPVALIIGLVRNSLNILGAILAFAFSPFTALFKGIYLAVNPRFARGDLGMHSKTEQALRNLYSHVNAMGDFRIGDIKDNQNGKKGAGNFIRRSFIFALQSTTEEVLTSMLNVWNDEDSEEKLDAAVKEVKDSYAKNIFIRKADRTLKLREIDHAAQFIKDYVAVYKNEQQLELPKIEETFYSQFKKQSWAATMFGGTHESKKRDTSDKDPSYDSEDIFGDDTHGNTSMTTSTTSGMDDDDVNGLAYNI